MKHTIRTFVAVEINAAIRQRAVALIEELAAAPAEVKWVAAHQMHFTLKFLGDVASREIPRVCEVVAAGAAEVDPFEMEVRGAGGFPNARQPRTVWLGVGGGEPEMVALHGHVERRLEKLGFRTEHRRFQPHLTLGRIRRSGPGVDELGQLLELEADYLVGRVRVGEVVVMSSELGRDGPTYGVLGRARLGAK